MEFKNDYDFAKQLDSADNLNSFRKEFYFPMFNEKEALYFTGNSLGLQSKNVQNYILNELEDWANYGVEGHFLARNPWFSYHEFFAKPTANIVGSLASEVVVMNQLTVNLHLLMASFYRPTSRRFKIICEAKAFPSDQYAIESQIKFHGFDPELALIEVHPRAGELCIRHEDILNSIEANKDELSLVLIGGVNYLTGQLFDLQKITKAAHQAGAIAGFDLAHAAGNVELKLHDWNVDFACWCTYKYLNSGPGSVGGVFIHERHHKSDLPRFAGWWGHNKESRFKMEKGFRPIDTAEGWQLSNAPILSMAAHRAALEVFENAGFNNLLEKSKNLTSYAEYIISEVNKELLVDGNKRLEVITPTMNNANDYFGRGCQLSIVAHGFGKKLYDDLKLNGVITDWREPNVVRIAPVPLYNSYEDVYLLGEVLKKIIKS